MHLLNALGISQRELARRVGVTGSFISLIVNNQTIPSIAMVRGLADEFGVSPDWYLTGQGPVFRASPALVESERDPPELREVFQAVRNVHTRLGTDGLRRLGMLVEAAFGGEMARPAGRRSA